MAQSYDFPKPSVTVDCIIFGLDEGNRLKVLLIQRAKKPFKDFWALPGGFIDINEGLKDAALRELEEETGVTDVFIEQLFTFGTPGRDPRGRVITVAYYALVNLTEHPVRSSTDAKNVEWFDIHDLPKLAFDHAEIMKLAIQRLRTKMRYQPIGFELLPEQFTLSQVQKLYEKVLGVKELNKRNFRTRILKMGVLDEVGIQENVSHRPAKLYSFNKEKYNQLFKEKYQDLIKRGLDWEI